MAGQLTIDTLKASSGVLATQNGMTGIGKAWVNWAGASGTINSSFNVSSVTRNGTGDYTVNFTTAMPDANYAVGAFGCNTGGTSKPVVCQNNTRSTYSTTQLAVLVGESNVAGSAALDAAKISIVVIGN